MDVNKNQVESVLARLKLEFVETAGDQLDEVETNIDWVDSGRTLSKDETFGIQRNVHNIKGQGATFGFPTVGRVAHLFEDYLENVGGVTLEHVQDYRKFVDAMRDLLQAEETMTDEQTASLLRMLPSGRPVQFSGQEIHNITVLLAMRKGVQSKLVSEELLQCGFHVKRAQNSMEALAYALDILPDIVVANFDMSPFSGLEMSRVFAGINRLRDIHFVLLTSYEAGDGHLVDVPDTVSVVEKGPNYAEKLSQLLLDWGVFGNV